MYRETRFDTHTLTADNLGQELFALSVLSSHSLPRIPGSWHRISQETVNVYNNLHTYNSVELYNSYFCKPVYLYYILYLMSCAPGKQLPNVATCQITVAGPGTYT